MAKSRPHEAATYLTVHIQPRAKRTEVVGWYGDAVKIRVSTPPVEGAANRELIRFVAAAAGLPRSAVQIVSGATGRRKRLTVIGVEAAELYESLGVKAR